MAPTSNRLTAGIVRGGPGISCPFARDATTGAIASPWSSTVGRSSYLPMSRSHALDGELTEGELAEDCSAGPLEHLDRHARLGERASMRFAAGRAEAVHTSLRTHQVSCQRAFADRTSPRRPLISSRVIAAKLQLSSTRTSSGWSTASRRL